MKNGLDIPRVLWVLEELLRPSWGRNDENGDLDEGGADGLKISEDESVLVFVGGELGAEMKLGFSTPGEPKKSRLLRGL
jgi:hypothetical protein